MKNLIISFTLAILGFLPQAINAKTFNPKSNFDSIAKRIDKIKTSIPIEYNQYVQSYIDQYTDRNNTDISNQLSKAFYYLPDIEKQLKKNRLPIELRYLAFALSGMDNHKISEEGGSGVWQLKYYVAKTYGLKINSYIDERRDIEKSTDAAILYFEDLYKIYEDWNLVIAAFYSSELEVNKAIRQSGGNLEYWKIHNYLSAQAQVAVPKFISTIYIIHHFRNHKIPVTTFKTIKTDTVYVKNWTTFEQINKITGIETEFLKEYNPIFKKGIIPYNVNKYFIYIPYEKVMNYKDNEDSLYVFKFKEPGIVTLPGNRPKPNSSDTSAIDDGSNAQNIDDSNNPINEDDTEKQETQSKTDNLKNKKIVIYKVKKGDGLGRIAKKYKCTIYDIKKWNNLKSNNIIPGQKLKIYVEKPKSSKTSKSKKKKKKK